MIAEKIIGNLSNTLIQDKNIETVTIDWFERDKKLLKKTTSNGEEIGIRIGTQLNEGDIIFQDETKIIAVTISPTELIAITVDDICTMGRLCFEIGNRHLSLSIKPDVVKVPYDEPTYQYLLKLGFNAKPVTEKFTDYKVCQGHGEHHHHHDHSHSGEHHHE